MAEGGEERLPDLYEKIWSCWGTLDSTEEPSSSYNVQVQKTPTRTKNELTLSENDRTRT